jgi:hypothetical protein
MDWEIGFRWMIAHALFRNRRMDTAGKWLSEMEGLLPNQVFRTSPHYRKFISLQASVAALSNQNARAIDIAQTALKDEANYQDDSEILNIRLNLAVFHFHEGEFLKANQTIRAIPYDDNWLEERMGIEWRFKKKTIELIIQYELGKEDVVASLIKHIKGYFAEFLSQDIYTRAAVFLKFVFRLMSNPDLATTESIRREVLAAKLGWPGHIEDLQAITFFCWLRSKMQQREYYEVLLERINEGIEEEA